jgi:hypothetical protein
LGIEILPPTRKGQHVCPVAQIPSDQNAKIEDGTFAIYAYGTIKYRDAFGRPQTTNYRVFCGGEGYPQGRMSPDIEGNEAT